MLKYEKDINKSGNISLGKNGLILTKKEAKFILKRVHSDITNSNDNDELVKKLIKIIK